MRQEIGTQGLAAIGDLSISFTYDELRDFVIAYKLVKGDAASAGQSLQAALATLPGRPIYEGVFRYAYLLSRNANDAATIAVCEKCPDFSEHFSLNVHLLPPAKQNDEDVARIKALLADNLAPERLRRAAYLLLRRSGNSGLLNVTILLVHLNGLDTDKHASFISTMFASHHDYQPSAWRQRIDDLVEEVEEDYNDNELSGYEPEWLSFFLHASSHASWSERESVSTMFGKAKGVSNCRIAVELVRPARAQAIRVLLSDMDDGEDARL